MVAPGTSVRSINSVFCVDVGKLSLNKRFTKKYCGTVMGGSVGLLSSLKGKEGKTPAANLFNLSDTLQSINKRIVKVCNIVRSEDDIDNEKKVLSQQKKLRNELQGISNKFFTALELSHMLYPNLIEARTDTDEGIILEALEKTREEVNALAVAIEFMGTVAENSSNVSIFQYGVKQAGEWKVGIRCPSGKVNYNQEEGRKILQETLNNIGRSNKIPNEADIVRETFTPYLVDENGRTPPPHLLAGNDDYNPSGSSRRRSSISSSVGSNNGRFAAASSTPVFIEPIDGVLNTSSIVGIGDGAASSPTITPLITSASKRTPVVALIPPLMSLLRQTIESGETSKGGVKSGSIKKKQKNFLSRSIFTTTRKKGDRIGKGEIVDNRNSQGDDEDSVLNDDRLLF